MSGDQVSNSEFERLLGQGFEHFYVGEYDQADVLYEQARELCPTNGRPLVLQGRSRMMRGRVDEARDKFLEALDVEPGCVQAYEGFSALYSIYAGDRIKPIQCLLYGLQIDSERHRLWVLLLGQLEMLKMQDLLGEVADLAMRHAVGDDEPALSLRCAVYKSLGRHQEFITEAQRLAESFPESRTAKMYAVMAGWLGHVDGQELETPSEEESEPVTDEGADAWREMLEDYAQTYIISDDVRQSIVSMWSDFLDRRLPQPEL